MAAFCNMICVLFLVLSVALARSSPTDEAAERQRELSKGISRFTQSFYKVTADLNPGQNVIMSPLSAEMALALLSLGAEGDTLEELNRALYLPSKDFTKSTFRPAIEELNAAKGVTLSIANRVFVKEGEEFVLSTQFKKDAGNVFQSEAENVDFTKSVQAAQIINSWVEKKTNDKIKDLISSASLNDQTRLILVNAIYFKGAWADKFSEESTVKKDFFVTATEKSQVDTMHQTGHFRYGEFSDWDAKVLELPYEGDEISMVIVLPNKVDGLAALEQKLTAEDADIQGHVEKLHKGEVNVALPKFKIETTIGLTKTLPKIGITKIFKSGAQLGGLLDGGEELVVSEAVQKAFIEVNERGSEAAAATYLGLVGASLSFDIPSEFQADHPFIFIVNSQRPLFIGKFAGK